MTGWFAYAPGEPQPDEPGPADGPSLDPDVAEGLARALRDVLEMAGRAQPRTKSATVDWIESHLGAPLGELTTVTTEWPAWRHASVQSGVEAYLPPGVEWIGLRSRHVEHMALIDLLMHEPGMGQTLAQPQLIEVATGPDTMADAFRVALCRLATDDGSPVVLCLRRSDEHGPPQVAIELVLSDPKAGAPVLQRLRELVDEHDVLRGQVVTFGPSEHYGNHIVSFLPRPDVGPDDVVEVSIFEWEANDQTKTLQLRVSETGVISLPAVGALNVDGKSVQEIQRLIEQELIAQNVLQAPRVGVWVSEFRSRQISVIGSVNQPGTYAIHQNVSTLLDMLTLAGGPQDSAGGLAYVIRRGKGRSESRILIDLDELLKCANEALDDYRLRTHDTLMTPFKGLRQDGRYRRRLDFAAARHLLDRCVQAIKSR